ncbi:MAG: type II 3-dehydroquinate dehydratase [Melioribacteraceae bacterium]
MKILILNGPNLNLLEKRDSGNYGKMSLSGINNALKSEFPEIDFSFFQTNCECELIDYIQKSDIYDGLIINPGGFTHTSVGIRDALDLLKIPKIEVHLSNLASREDFRKNMITTSGATGYISGFKELSYFSAVYTLKKILLDK